MSTIEEWERHCAYCRQPITLKWKNGPMPSEAVCLVVDQVFHNKCWDKFWADHNGKRGSHLSSPASTSTVSRSTRRLVESRASRFRTKEETGAWRSGKVARAVERKPTASLLQFD
jgi:hypothetical protein